MRQPKSLIRSFVLCLLAIGLLSLFTTVYSLLSLNMSMRDGEAINVSGSMRMQSYRLAYDIQSQDDLFDLHVKQFESSLYSPSMSALDHWAAPEDIRNDYLKLIDRWLMLKRVLLSDRNDQYLHSVQEFVTQIDQLVSKLQVYSEKKLQNLALIGGFGLGGILVVSLYILLIVRKRVLEPVNGLIEASQSIQSREFDIHLKPSGSKEMDYVGRSFTLMSKELGQLYDDLESAVAQKTSELQQANGSLNTLYRTTSLLADPSLNYSLFQTMLDELVAHSSVAGVKAIVIDESDVDVLFVSGASTGAITTQRKLQYSDIEQGQITLFLNEEVDESFIESFTQIYSRAIYYKATKKQQQQLLIHTERATIARELHDSLAQNLSYLKIQTVLLKRELSSHPVVLDLDEGLRSCYQQLRELLKTFRLPVGELNFAEALKTTVEDLQGRTDAKIEYNNQLNSLRLTAEQHVHVLQIVREATLNAAKHARASHISIACIDRGNEVCIEVNDDGKGFEVGKSQDGHYGLAILHERTEQLGGTISIESTIGQGSRIHMCFEPQA